MNYNFGRVNDFGSEVREAAEDGSLYGDNIFPVTTREILMQVASGLSKAAEPGDIEGLDKKLADACIGLFGLAVREDINLEQAIAKRLRERGVSVFAGRQNDEHG